MATVFELTFRPILIISKLFGLIDISYTFGPSGLLVKDANNSTYYFIVESIRLFVLITCTYLINTENTFVRHLCLLKFWVIFIASRISQGRIITLINGIVEFDQKLTFITTSLLKRRFKSELYWYVILACSLAYNVLIKMYYLYPWERRRLTITSFVDHIFSAPYVIDFVVCVTTIFYLNNLEWRFKLLNDLWQCLSPDPVTVHCGARMMQSEMKTLIEKIRLLHFQLLELITAFSLGYGKLLTGYFSLMLVEMFTSYYYMICFIGSVPSKFLNENNIKYIPYIVSVQSKFFLAYIIISASRVIQERTKIITHLRQTRLTNVDRRIKLQVKMFMNQLSVIDAAEITAYGFFNVNLNLIVSIIGILATGLSTLIQMKRHPIIMQITNESLSELNVLFKNYTI